MVPAPDVLAVTDDEDGRERLFASIAQDLLDRGYSINPCALTPGLANGLLQHLHSMPGHQFVPAGIGREQDQMLNSFVRKDTICWITGESTAGRQWLDWAGQLQTFLNRQLFLGLFSFESHFAHYAPRAFYRRHFDAFKGGSNRVLSIVAYLNPGWLPDQGGELVLYPEGCGPDGIRVTPAFGTLAVFLSEDFEHEVLPAQRDRFSIAGWFRVNSSTARRADPPL
jgi:SM-20-related protein